MSKLPSKRSLADFTPPELPDLPDPRRLHEATDNLNAVLVEAEKALADLKLGVSAYVTLDESDDGWFRVLLFAKSGRDFKLLIQTGHEHDETAGETTVLTSASRETRLQAVEALPKLYRKLVKEFEAEIERVKTSITEVQQLTQASRAKGGK